MEIINLKVIDIEIIQLATNYKEKEKKKNYKEQTRPTG